MRLPFTNRFLIESKVFFHSYDEVEKPGIYKGAKSIVLEDKLVSVDTDILESG